MPQDHWSLPQCLLYFPGLLWQRGWLVKSSEKRTSDPNFESLKVWRVWKETDHANSSVRCMWRRDFFPWSKGRKCILSPKNLQSNVSEFFKFFLVKGQVRKFEPFICLANQTIEVTRVSFIAKEQSLSEGRRDSEPYAEKCTVFKSLYTLSLSSKGI